MARVPVAIKEAEQRQVIRLDKPPTAAFRCRPQAGIGTQPNIAYQKRSEKIQKSENDGNNNEISLKSEWNYDKMINLRFLYLDCIKKIPKRYVC